MSKKVAIVGLGYVGLPLAVLAALKSYEVTGLDLDQKKLTKIRKGVSPITDDFVEQNLEPGLFKITDNSSAISQQEIIIVCVPTPVKYDYQPDLEPLKKAVTAIAKHLKKGALLIIESTINPGVSDEIIIPLIEQVSGKKASKDFYLAHCPERINPGDEHWTVANIPRIIGASDAKGLQLAVDFYSSILDAPIHKMASLKEAEAVKIVENAFRDINIAFVNELAMSFSQLGINVLNVINAAATKPFAFMPHYPGVGVGGHCIPVDPYYLIEYAKQKGFHHEFLSLARNINNQMPEFTVQQLTDTLNEAGLTLREAKVAILGISYKPNLADDRESPAYKVATILKDKQVNFDMFDPYVAEKSTVKSVAAALKDKDAVLLVTAHDEFKKLDFAKYKHLKVIIDGRNCLNAVLLRKAGLIYRGIGV